MGSPFRRSSVAVATVVAAVLAVWTAMAPPAAAHASLVGTSPAAGETLQAPPGQVVVSFDDTVSAGGDAIRLFDPGGAEVDGLDVDDGGDVLTADLPPLDDEGSYTVSWKAVSVDGHPIAGTFLFHVGAPSRTEPAVAAGTTGTPTGAALLRVAGTVLAFGAFTVIAGPAWFGRRRRADRRWWLAALGGTALLIAGGVWASDGLTTFTDTTSGAAVVATAGAALAGLLLDTVNRSTTSPVPATVGLVVLALPGHAVALAPVPRSVVLTVVHVVAAAVWLAALLELDRTARAGDGTGLAEVVRRRSPALMGAVALLAASGTWLLVGRVGWGALASDTYGRLGLAKVALLGVALVLAAWHRFGLTPLLPARQPVPAGADVARPAPAVRRMQTGLRWEMSVLAVAVIAGAGLAQVDPGGDDTDTAGGPFTERIDAGAGHRAELYVYPGEVGRNDLHLYVFDDGGLPATDVGDLGLRLSFASQGIEDLAPDLVTVTESHVIAQNVQIPFGGTWTVELTGRTDRFDSLDGRWAVPFGPG